MRKLVIEFGASMVQTFKFGLRGPQKYTRLQLLIQHDPPTLNLPLHGCKKVPDESCPYNNLF